MTRRRPPPHNVLVLQGGGALGAYQGGVYEALAGQGLLPDWVVGTSIGAVNGALIAGNPPERRVARLREFWQRVGHDDPLAPLSATPWGAWLMPWIGAADLLGTVALGIPGFFQPRPGSPLNINLPVPTRDAGFYDTAPLRSTLRELVDFDYLNDGPMRCTVCAVEIASGELVTFDSRRQELTVDHVMASGALPPGFPPVIIDGKAYWDGGIYSNTPVDIVMDDAERRDTLCFMVDLWDPTEAEPRSISDAMARQKDIQYASRTREHLEDHRTMQNLRRAVEILARHLPPDAVRGDQTLRALAGLGCTSTIDIVRLILKSDPEDGYNKDVDFARERLRRRWQLGVRDGERALRHQAWLRPLPEPVGMVIHELPQEE